MKNIAMIPARSGSKGLKDKNIRLLNGKPLLAYSIEAAIQSKLFDEIMVSTDSSYYADIAEKYGAKVPFLRSEGNSSDSASSWDTVQEILSFYRNAGEEFDSFCLLQPTSPLRNEEDIINAYDIYKAKEAVAVVSVCEVEHSPLWCGHLGENGSLNGFISERDTIQRQAVRPFYRINGAIYIAGVNEFEKDRFLYREGSYAYVMSREKSVDIDCLGDFQYAEFLMRNH
ncbi:acylneuraminate cytidylyltransferase family protein [Lachnospiraceae bacterium 48-21]